MLINRNLNGYLEMPQLRPASGLLTFLIVRTIVLIVIISNGVRLGTIKNNLHLNVQPKKKYYRFKINFFLLLISLNWRNKLIFINGRFNAKVLRALDGQIVLYSSLV